MILAILNLYVASMLPTQFRLNPTYGLGENVVRRILRWPPYRPYWILEWNDFTILNLNVTPIKFRLNPTYILGQDTSFEVQDGRLLGYQNGTIWSILNFHAPLFPPLPPPPPPLKCLPATFSSVRLTVQEKMSKMWKVKDIWTYSL